MRFNSIVIICSILFTYNAHSQNWKSGFVLTHENDTLKGQLDIEKSDHTICIFKDANGSKLEFKPTEIAGYGRSSELYLVKNVPTKSTPQLIFLEALVLGDINLYQLNQDKPLIYLEYEGMLHHLVNTSSDIIRGGQTFKRERKEYLGILSNALRHADMQKEIEKAALSSKSLTQLLLKYYEIICNSECISYQKTKEKRSMPISLGLQAGPAIHRIEIGNMMGSESVMGWQGGIRMMIEPFEKISKLRLSLSANISHFNKYTFPEEKVGAPTKITLHGETYSIIDGNIQHNYKLQDKIEVDLNLTRLSVPLMITYDFTRGSVKPYIGIGLLNEFVIHQNKEFDVAVMSRVYDKSIPTHSIGELIQLGCKFRLTETSELLIDANFSRSSSINVNDLLLTHHYTSFMGVGYNFMF